MIALAGYSSAMRVFDCNHPESTFRPIDLLEPQPCPDPIKDFSTPVITALQILQTDTKFPVHAHQCKIVISKEVTRCGLDSITYGSEWPVWEKTLELTPNECRSAIETGTVTVEKMVYAATPGAPTTNIFFSHGSRTSDGRCMTATFTTNGILYQRSYETTILNIQIAQIRGTVDLSSGLLVFANGLRVKFKDEVVRDAVEGTIVWRAKEPDCKDTVSEIYLGNGTLHVHNNGLINSIVMIANNESDQYAGLVIRKPQAVCGMHCHATQIQGIVLCLLRDHDTPMPQANFKSYFDPTIPNLQAQLSFTHLGTNMKMYRRFETMQQALCEVDRKVMHNKIQAISGANNQYALLDYYGPGYRIYVAGTAAYVTNCHALEGVRVDYPNCTMEVPVSVNGTRLFADPFTWTLHEFPTIVPCSDVMPIRWRINGNWYCATPNARRCPAPTQLNVTNSIAFRAEDFTEGLGHGIFTNEQLASHRAYEITMTSRAPAVAKITNAMTQDGSSARLGIPISNLEFRNMKLDIAGLIFPLIHWFGEAWIYISGLLLIGLCIKIIANMAVRTFILYREKGCGCWMAAAVIDTTFLLFRTPWLVIKKAGAAIMEPVTHQGEDMDFDAHGVTYSGLHHALDKQKVELDRLQKALDDLGVDYNDPRNDRDGQVRMSLLGHKDRPIVRSPAGAEAGATNSATHQSRDNPPYNKLFTSEKPGETPK